MKWIVLDTSVLINQFRTDCHRDRILSLDGIVRTSSVVMAELLRGVKTTAERRIIASMQQGSALLTPTRNHWTESGELLANIRRNRGLTPEKLRDLHFDVLIALTARSAGARLITSNRTDFEMIREYRSFDLEVW